MAPHLPTLVINLLNLAYVLMAIAIAVYANRLFKSLPIGLWGDIAVAAAGFAAFTFFLKTGYDRALLELNDWYPAYFSLAYAPWVAFVSIGFVRSITQFLPAPAAQPAMAMAASSSGTPAAMPSAAAGSAANSVASNPVPPPLIADFDPVGADPETKQEPTWKRRLKLAFWSIILILIALTSVARFVARNDLPGCSAQPTKEVIAKIYQPLKVEFKRYDEVETKTSADDLITCAASVTLMNDQHAYLEYAISREEGGKFIVKIIAARDK